MILTTNIYIVIHSILSTSLGSFVHAALHSEDTILGVTGLDSISTSHGSVQTETEVMSSVLRRDNAIIL